jgi:protein-S-isoprenylcysteine O-methyltransferase Ste14
VPLMVNYLVIGPEETYLQERFFGPYQEYKRRVRKWI